MTVEQFSIECQKKSDNNFGFDSSLTTVRDWVSSSVIGKRVAKGFSAMPQN